jgi:hypothetical protein
MATRKGFNVTVDISQVRRLADVIGNFSGDRLGAAVVTTLNEVVERTDEELRDRMNAGINLSDDYLRRKVVMAKASKADPKAELRVSDEPVPLGRYDARTQVVEAKSPPSMLKGNKALGIPVGQKQKGVAVQVRRGSVNTGFMERGFLMPLRRGDQSGGNGIGVFARNRAGRVVHRYGPSVYQLFGYQADRITDEVGDDLEETLIANIDAMIEKGLNE